MTEAKNRLFEDELVKNIVPADTRIALDTCLKSGWVGAAVREGYSRLYLSTPEMTEWLEFRDEDVVHRVDLPREQFFLGGSVLWFKSGTRFSYERTRPLKAQAAFLDGELRRRFLGEATVANQANVAFTGLPCTILISILACTILQTCHHIVAESGCGDPPT